MNSQEICHLKCNVAAFTVNYSERQSLTWPTLQNRLYRTWITCVGATATDRAFT